MAARAANNLARRTVPRLVAAGAGVSLGARLGEAARRRRGRPGALELYIAFDDPCSAVAALELAQLTAGRAVEVVHHPVIRRGMKGDPAVALKRRYAILDAGRLARRRLGRELTRREPLPAAATAFLAEWVAATPMSEGRTRFCLDALAALWFAPAPTTSRDAFAALWREHLDAPPPADRAGGAAAVRLGEARMARRGIYETPAAWIAGRWFFAQDRPLQVCEWLDELGWGVAV